MGFQTLTLLLGVFCGLVSTQAGDAARPLESRPGWLENMVVGSCKMMSELGCIFLPR